MRKIVECIVLALLPIVTVAADKTKQIYAHYMGCWPAGIKSMQRTVENVHKTNPASSDLFDAIGGRIVNLPLLPQKGLASEMESAELEIKRAIRGGFDGFAIDAWAGDVGAKRTLDCLFAAAEKMKVPFYLTICMDPSCQGKNEKEPGNLIEIYAESIKWLLKNHGESPNLARRDGKPLIFGYYSSVIYRSEAYKKASVIEREKMTKAAYDQVKKLVGQDLYLHYSFDDGAKDDLERAAFVGKNYDAVGGFLGIDHNWRMNNKLISAFKSGGAEWSMPMWFQYNNKKGGLHPTRGTQILRDNWAKALETKSTLIQFVTWNDYGEETSIAPGYEVNYTMLNLNRYFVDWWKQGAPPKIEKDVIHVSFNKNMPGTMTYPFHCRRASEGCVEVLTLLKAPARVEVKNYGSYDAPAGLFVKQFDMKVGAIHVDVTRDKLVVATVTTHEEITDLPYRENNTLTCFSSNFEEEWAKDFPNEKPLYYSEYGDVDGDGLPNWFEMHWFGKYPYMETATNANARADSDGDWLSNLQEWKLQKNPLVKEGVYEPGYIWDIEEVHKRGISFNPDRDSFGSPVWYYFYKLGKAGTIQEDGNYTRSTDAGQNVPYAGLLAHFSPSVVPGYKHTYAWIARKKNDDGSMNVNFTPRKECMPTLAWKSPINGVVELSAKGTFKAGSLWHRFSIKKNNEEIFSRQIKNGESDARIDLNSVKINVKIGDFIYFNSNAGEGGASAELTKLEIKFASTAVTNVSYYDESDYKIGNLEYLKERCKLDVYLPAGVKNFKTFVWFHGGGITGGSRHIPELIDRSKIGIVAVDYRLSGERAKCPDYLYDAAAAVAWTLKNIESYGGAKDEVYVSGMSAGGYLSAMVALAPKYLEAFGCKPTDLAGAFPVSGQMTTHFQVLNERREIDSKVPDILIDEYAPIYNASANAPKIALFVGDTNYEWNSRNEENALLESRLRRQFNDKNVRLYILPACSHGTVCTPSLSIVNSILNGWIKIW